MKNPIASLYEQILLNEAEKSALENPSNNEVGKVTGIFGGEKPDTKKVSALSNKDAKTDSAKNLEHDLTNPEDPEGEEDKNAEVRKGNLKSSVPTKPTEETEGNKPKPKGLGEEFTMGAFETLFRKTLVIENEEDEAGDTLDFETGSEAPEEGSLESEEESEESSVEDEEGDLLSDLQDLQVRITDIITKLEKAVEDESGATTEDQGYSEEDFDQEFGEEEPKGESEEEEVKTESVVSPLQKKDNKVGGKLKATKGKAVTGKTPKVGTGLLGDKKKALQHGNTAKSSVKKGDFFK
jgi:hypothetical protein